MFDCPTVLKSESPNEPDCYDAYEWDNDLNHLREFLTEHNVDTSITLTNGKVYVNSLPLDNCYVMYNIKRKLLRVATREYVNKVFQQVSAPNVETVTKRLREALATMKHERWLDNYSTRIEDDRATITIRVDIHDVLR